MTIGTDIVEIQRIAAAVQRQPAFWQRILTPEEEALCRKKGDGITALAGRFAAKEAVMKALGCGLNRLAFRDIVILAQEGGRPLVVPGPRLSQEMDLCRVAKIEVSISHCRTYATAVALAVSCSPEPCNGKETGR